MAQVAQQLPQTFSRISESKETLMCSLDDLLERYLQLLDTYQILQQDISRDLSNVCIFSIENNL